MRCSTSRKPWARLRTVLSLWFILSAGPVLRVAPMNRDHLEETVSATVKHATSTRSEEINAKIQRIKRLAFGFPNRDRFMRAIYFHLVGLDLNPTPVSPAGQTQSEV